MQTRCARRARENVVTRNDVEKNDPDFFAQKPWTLPVAAVGLFCRFGPVKIKLVDERDLGRHRIPDGRQVDVGDGAESRREEICDRLSVAKLWWSLAANLNQRGARAVSRKTRSRS